MDTTFTIGIAFIAFLVVMGLFYVLSRVAGRGDEDLEGRLDQFVNRQVRRIRSSRSTARRRASAGASVSSGRKGFRGKIAPGLARDT